MSTKAVHHVCIQTSKYEESLHFYTEILGFRLVRETTDFHGRDFYTWLSMGAFIRTANRESR